MGLGGEGLFCLFLLCCCFLDRFFFVFCGGVCLFCFCCCLFVVVVLRGIFLIFLTPIQMC